MMEGVVADMQDLTLLEEYKLIMKAPADNLKNSFIQHSWEKSGDLFKQFSLFDYSKYSTSTKANINGESQKGVLCQAGMK